MIKKPQLYKVQEQEKPLTGIWQPWHAPEARPQLLNAGDGSTQEKQDEMTNHQIDRKIEKNNDYKSQMIKAQKQRKPLTRIWRPWHAPEARPQLLNLAGSQSCRPVRGHVVGSSLAVLHVNTSILFQYTASYPFAWAPRSGPGGILRAYSAVKSNTRQATRGRNAIISLRVCTVQDTGTGSSFLLSREKRQQRRRRRHRTSHRNSRRPGHGGGAPARAGPGPLPGRLVPALRNRQCVDTTKNKEREEGK